MEKIYEIGGSLDLAITLHDNIDTLKSGRVYLDDFANHRSIPLLKVKHINETVVEQRIRELHIDWLFVIGWSQIAGPRIIAAPRLGVLGIHPTLLPEGRGRASIPWAILKGLDKTGVTLFMLDEEVDAGPILAQEVLSVGYQEDATSLYSRVTEAHKTLLANVWQGLEAGIIDAVAQDETKATYWQGRTPQDGEISSDMTVEGVDRLVRATTHPYPGAFVMDQKLGLVRIWSGQSMCNAGAKTGFCLKLRDGYFNASEFEIES